VIAAMLAACLGQDCRTDLGAVIDRLGSDCVREREDASAILRYVGEPALPDLDRAAKSGDPEVAGRARALIAYLGPHRPEVLREMAHLFLHACGTFRGGRLEASARYAEAVLRIDPGYAPARELLEAAARAREEEGARERFLERVDAWREETREDLGLLPGARSIRYLSRTSWAEIARHLRCDVHLFAATDVPECIHIHRKLETMKIDLAFENTKLEDILAFIRDFSGLNIILDAAVRDRVDPDREITFKVKDLALKNVLKLLLAQFGLDYVVTREQVVLLTESGRRGDPGDF